jgi:hypothetical protein
MHALGLYICGDRVPIMVQPAGKIPVDNCICVFIHPPFVLKNLFKRDIRQRKSIDFGTGQFTAPASNASGHIYQATIGIIGCL